MDRFSETIPTYSPRDRDEDGYPDAPYTAEGLKCENCYRTAERLTDCPDKDFPRFMLCDECMEEALAVAAADVKTQYVATRREPSTADLLYRLEDLLAARKLKGAA